MNTIEELVQHNRHPNTWEAICYWADKDEPEAIELLLIDMHPEIYPTFRGESDEFTRAEYEW